MSRRVDGKRVLVIGAGSSGPGWGNGKAAAALYAREGAFVACVDRNLAAAEETAALIEGEGGRSMALAADVTDENSLAIAVGDVVDVAGGIDILHHNVGIAATGGPTEGAVDDWTRVIDVNQTGFFLTCRHVLPVMEQAGKGAVVAIASIAATRWIGFPYLAYTASKAAMLGMVRNLALQYAPQGIRVNAILPGMMDTPMIREPLTKMYGGDVDEMIDTRNRQCPMGHMGNAWDVAQAALFLASDEARYITGAELVVDGGLSLTCVSAPDSGG